jgi:hypothetical protein
VQKAEEDHWEEKVCFGDFDWSDNPVVAATDVKNLSKIIAPKKSSPWYKSRLM